MLLIELPFPITIVAPDGWAGCRKAPEDIRDWGMHGIQKYGRIGFIVADANGSVWRMVKMVSERKLKIWERFKLEPVLLPTRVTVEPVPGDALAVFREHFTKALEKDDDILSQAHTKEKIKTVLDSADSLPTLLATLHSMRVT